MEHGGSRSGQAAAWEEIFSSAYVTSLRPAVSCISDRANGIRANRCRDGHSVVTGVPTDYRSGTIREWVADPDRDYGFGEGEAQRFAEEFARTLSIDPEDYLVAAYEDPLAYLLKERQLPVNVDPKDNKLDDPEERERLRRVFERGLGNPVGFVLPLQRGYGKNGPEWQTALWMLRARHLFLVPGDSPVGLPSSAAQPAVGTCRADSTDVGRGPDGAGRSVAGSRHVSGRLETTQVRPATSPTTPVVRTALTVEAREGRIWVFHAARQYHRRLHRVARRARRHGGPVEDADSRRRISAS